MLAFEANQDISERVIFPVTASQSNGIEDARFVRFEDEASSTYYATYTAYDGRGIRSELLQTDDFVTFRMRPLKERRRGTRAWLFSPARSTGATP